MPDKPLSMYEEKALRDAPPTDVVPEVSAGRIAPSKVTDDAPSAGHVGKPEEKPDHDRA